MATFQSLGSGWRLHSIIRLELHIVGFVLSNAGSYIPLTKELAAKQAIIYIKNHDDIFFFFFLCRVLRALNPKQKD